MVRNRLTGTPGNDGQQDGMDVILLAVESVKESGNTVVISYSVANNAPLLVRNKEIIELSKDKMAVGKSERAESFSTHTITLQKGDNLYLCTDDFGDQFGRLKGKNSRTNNNRNYFPPAPFWTDKIKKKSSHKTSTTGKAG